MESDELVVRLTEEQAQALLAIIKAAAEGGGLNNVWPDGIRRAAEIVAAVQRARGR